VLSPASSTTTTRSPDWNIASESPTTTNETQREPTANKHNNGRDPEPNQDATRRARLNKNNALARRHPTTTTRRRGKAMPSWLDYCFEYEVVTTRVDP
jgi:hypothetical protein